jgi:hypothetical protein
MACNAILNVSGLVLNILGGLILAFAYNKILFLIDISLSAAEDYNGVLGGDGSMENDFASNKGNRKKAMKCSKRISFLGIVLLILGFVLQLLGLVV